MRIIPLNKTGFTLMELLIIGPILMVVIAVMMNFMFNQYGQLLIQNTAVNMQVQATNIINGMKQDVLDANDFLGQPDTSLVDDYSPEGGWKSASNNLIISKSALSASPKNSAVSKVYINSLGCSPESTLIQNDVLPINIIYYTEGENLYKRVVANTNNISTCGTGYLKQTCPVAHASGECPEDKLLTNQLDSLSVKYFDDNGNMVNKPEAGKLVQIDLKLKDKAYSETVSAGSSLKIRRIGL